MMNSTRFLHLVVCLAAVAMFCCGALSAQASTIPVGQVDNFNDGQLDNWLGGGSNMMAVGQQIISGGGPGGAGDQYLQVNSGGASNAPRLLASNDVQWLGDFSNITAIEMDLFMPQSDVDNGVTTLPIRLSIREGTANNSAGYTYTTAFVLGDADHPAGQWWHAVFTLDASDFTAVGAGSPSHQPPAFNTLKANILDFRILNATSNTLLVGNAYSSSGPQISFGIDNITAVPEPSSVVLVFLGGASFLLLRRKKVRQTKNNI